jgi:hypothetical protein
MFFNSSLCMFFGSSLLIKFRQGLYLLYCGWQNSKDCSKGKSVMNFSSSVEDKLLGIGGDTQKYYLVQLIITCMDASDQEQSDEQQAGVKPIGIEEQKIIEKQEAEAAETRPTEDIDEPPASTTEGIIGKAQEENKTNIKQNVDEKTKLKDPSTKLFDQFTKHFQFSKIASGNTNNMLKQIQKQLIQMEKTNIIRNKQQVVIGQLVAQVKGMQKQLDKVNSSINRMKNIPNIKRKIAGIKRIKK